MAFTRLSSPRLTLVPVVAVDSKASLGRRQSSQTPADEAIAAEAAFARTWFAEHGARNQAAGSGSGPGTGTVSWVALLRATTSSTNNGNTGFEAIGFVELANASLNTSNSSATLVVPDDDLTDSSDAFSIESLGDGSPLLSAEILPPFHERGYATEAIKHVLLALFKAGFPKVQSVLSSNHPRKTNAESLLERLGFRIASVVTPSLNRNNKSLPQESWSVRELEGSEFLDLWA
ncbi:UNVERIFIED_CONTAM: hypothetical protein HDU68_006018 [Siphonaria sp. JEL0065]|nr:hypothetical protein HDU68_006018 [Siphonaria sp. JEL0065]